MIRTSESTDAISKAWVEAAAEMPNIAKSGTGNYGSYVPLDEVVETVRPVLATHGLAYVQGLSDGDKVVTVTTRLIHTSGEWMEDSLSLPTGQNTAQSVGSAITYGRRYSLMAILGLAPEDDDGEAASTAPKKTAAPRKAAAPRSAPETKPTEVASTGRVTQVIIEMGHHGIKDRDHRHEVCAQVLGHTVSSMNELTNAQLDKVLRLPQGAVMKRRIWKVHGSDANVFGVPKRRSVEVAAATEDEARAEALRLFPTLQVDDVRWTSAVPTTEDPMR